jgi:hypothetical protein
MTCEVAVANPLGIALAADSAVTFRDGSNKATYASGARKIFQLSDSEPIGVMIYNDATINDVPWELVLKAHRKYLGEQTFPALQDYWSHLVDFINLHSQLLLSDAVRTAGAASSYRDGILAIVTTLTQKRPILKDSNADPADIATNCGEALDEIEAELGALLVEAPLDQADLAGALVSQTAADLSVELANFINSHLQHLAPALDAQRVVALGIENTFKRPERIVVRYSGIVLAGYGSDDHLPAYLNARVFGFLAGKLYWKITQRESIDCLTNPSLIEAFAQKAMVETFTQGASPQVWAAVRRAFTTHAAEACRKAAMAAGVVLPDADISAAVRAELGDFQRRWTDDVLSAHLGPMRTVLAGLSVEELSELAETMVVLESLKEKVTSRTQGVGGPIDVAMITKSEGLVWIKRKLYFDAALNRRYLARLQAQ